MEHGVFFLFDFEIVRDIDASFAKGMGIFVKHEKVSPIVADFAAVGGSAVNEAEFPLKPEALQNVLRFYGFYVSRAFLFDHH